MQFVIGVTPGRYATERDLAGMAENIRLGLNTAVNDVAGNMFPEYTFSEVTVVNGTDPTGRHARFKRGPEPSAPTRLRRPTADPLEKPPCRFCGS
jgi:hypothetical protein